MKIEIKFFASLSRHMKNPLISDKKTMEWPEAASVGDLVDALGVPRKDIKLIFLNGVHAPMDAIVHDGDRIGIFPPIGGG